MAYKGMGGTVKVPKKIKTPVGTEERLIYANDEEIEMLRQAGGSGDMTPYGGVRSYYLGGTGYDYQGTTSLSDAYSQGTTSSNATGGTFSTLNSNRPSESGGGDSDNRPTFSYSTIFY